MKLLTFTAQCTRLLQSAVLSDKLSVRPSVRQSVTSIDISRSHQSRYVKINYTNNLLSVFAWKCLNIGNI